jgi:hypothetical protein
MFDFLACLRLRLAWNDVEEWRMFCRRDPPAHEREP